MRTNINNSFKIITMKRISYRSLFLMFFVIILLFPSSLTGQYLPQLSQADQSLYYLNPSTSGFQNFTVLTGYKKEWTGFENAPQTLYVGLNVNLTNRKTSIPSFVSNVPGNDVEKTKNFQNGISLFYLNDTYGFVKQDNLLVGYANHYRLTKNYYFSIGLAAGFFHLGFNDNITVNDQSDPYYINFINHEPSLTTFDADFGLSFYSDKIFFGYAIHHLVGSRIKFNSNSSFDNYLDLTHQFYFAAKANITDDIELSPFGNVRLINPYLSTIELGLKTKFKNMLSVGLAFRNNGAFVGSFNVKVSRIIIGYSYDYGISQMSKVNFSSHEFTVGYQIFDNSSMPKRFDWQ